MKVNNEAFFFVRNGSSLDIGAEIIRPAQAATLPTPVEPSKL